MGCRSVAQFVTPAYDNRYHAFSVSISWRSSCFQIGLVQIRQHEHQLLADEGCNQQRFERAPQSPSQGVIAGPSDHHQPAGRSQHARRYSDSE